jgi:hypothetical protein
MGLRRVTWAGGLALLGLLLLGCGPGIDSPFPAGRDSGTEADVAQAADAADDAKPDAPEADSQPSDLTPPDKGDPSKCKQATAAAAMHITMNRAHNCGPPPCTPGLKNNAMTGLCACANCSNEIIGTASDGITQVTVHWYEGAKPLCYFYDACP